MATTSAGVRPPLPRIVWVAARPPLPPFSGVTAKTLCGLDALTSLTDVDLLAFAEPSSIGPVKTALETFWKGRLATIHVLPLRTRTSSLEALRSRRFQTSTAFDAQALALRLTALNWSSGERLLIFDDILLAPIAHRYGANAILSPHDCISEMFLSHCRAQPLSLAKLRKYLQYRTARHYEQRFYDSVLLVHVIAHRDRVWLERINPTARYHVVANADLANPGLIREDDPEWDILIWGDVTIPSCATGIREFLTEARHHPRLVNARKLLVGKASKTAATRVLGNESVRQVTYSPRLEDEAGLMRSARIVVVPDIGGAGIKNRVLNVVSSGLCVACLIPQMEGLDAITDRGAINAVSMGELVKRIDSSLESGDCERIAAVGHSIYHESYGVEANRRLWSVMIQRAMSARHRALSARES